MENRISPGSNREFLPTDLFLCHSPHAPDKKLRGSMAGDVKDLLKCCSALITLTVVMNQLLLLFLVTSLLERIDSCSPMINCSFTNSKSLNNKINTLSLFPEQNLTSKP